MGNYACGTIDPRECNPMFGLLRRQKLNQVRGILEGRVNRSAVRNLNDGDRHGTRGALCEVAILVPYASKRRPDFASARPVLTRDMSWAGLSILDDTLLDAETVLVGLNGDSRFQFLHCLVEHCTHLGYGRFQIGLQPTEIAHLDSAERAAFDERVSGFSEQPASAEA